MSRYHFCPHFRSRGRACSSSSIEFTNCFSPLLNKGSSAVRGFFPAACRRGAEQVDRVLIHLRRREADEVLAQVLDRAHDVHLLRDVEHRVIEDQRSRLLRERPGFVRLLERRGRALQLAGEHELVGLGVELLGGGAHVGAAGAAGAAGGGGGDVGGGGAAMTSADDQIIITTAANARSNSTADPFPWSRGSARPSRDAGRSLASPRDFSHG